MRPVTRVAPTPRPVGETEAEQEATPAQAPEPVGPMIELVEITDQDLDSIILYDRFTLQRHTRRPVKARRVMCK